MSKPLKFHRAKNWHKTCFLFVKQFRARSQNCSDPPKSPAMAGGRRLNFLCYGEVESMKSILLAAALAMGLGISVCNQQAAAVPALDSNGGGTPATNPNPFTIGWAFDVLNPINVDGLGLWDEGGNGLATSHLVRLWTVGGTLLASATIDNSDTIVASALGAGHWLFDNSVALNLGVGRYVIGADGGFGTDAARAFDAITTIPDIAFVEARELLGGGFPTTSSQINGIFGPNLSVSIPEPGALALFGLGVLGLGLVRRRKTRTD